MTNIHHHSLLTTGFGKWAEGIRCILHYLDLICLIGISTKCILFHLCYVVLICILNKWLDGVCGQQMWLLWFILVCFQTPLHCAAANGSLEVVKLLIARGADITVKDVRRVYYFMKDELNGTGIINIILHFNFRIKRM